MFINEPEDYVLVLGELPKNVTVLKKPIESVDLVQFLVTSQKELEV